MNNANVAALGMLKKPKTEIIETMYPEDLQAQEMAANQAQPPMPLDGMAMDPNAMGNPDAMGDMMMQEQMAGGMPTRKPRM